MKRKFKSGYINSFFGKKKVRDEKKEETVRVEKGRMIERTGGSQNPTERAAGEEGSRDEKSDVSRSGEDEKISESERERRK